MGNKNNPPSVECLPRLIDCLEIGSLKLKYLFQVENRKVLSAEVQELFEPDSLPYLYVRRNYNILFLRVDFLHQSEPLLHLTLNKVFKVRRALLSALRLLLFHRCDSSPI